MKLKSLFLFAFPFALASCLLESEKKVDLSEFSFKTTDSSELFFKNVRQSDYDLTEMKEAKMNIFQLSKMKGGRMTPKIIHNWLLDEASIWLEFNSAFSVPFEISSQGENSGQVTFSGNNRMNHLEVANFLFESTLDSTRLFVADQELLPLGSNQRKNFKIVMNDYFRLVDLK